MLSLCFFTLRYLLYGITDIVCYQQSNIGYFTNFIFNFGEKDEKNAYFAIFAIKLRKK